MPVKNLSKTSGNPAQSIHAINTWASKSFVFLQLKLLREILELVY